MNTNFKNRKLLVPRWWNPLFWSVVIFAPLAVFLAGMLYGLLQGLLMGYEKGLAFSHYMLNRFISTMP